MPKHTSSEVLIIACGLLAAVLIPAGVAAQQPIYTTLPPIEVTAQKEPEDPKNLPVSVTAVTKGTLDADDLMSVSEAGWFAPNTYFNEFTARKLSNPRFRGVGASPSNPGVTSYVDGVPQLHANSSNIELLDVDQVEFVRGPQSALFGRNTVGGIINITSVRPSLTNWTGSLLGPYGNFNGGDLRGTVSGPLLTDKLAVGMGFGYGSRDGFTTNDVTGNKVDTRSAFFGKGQLLWKPNAQWEARAMFTGERARDGDYALNDLAALRANPYHTSRNIEGYTNRDILAPTFQVAYAGSRIEFTTVTGVLKWKTADLTDLDYTAMPLITRNNAEEDLQFTEELRFASAKAAPIVLSDSVTMKWQGGLFLFTQNYKQDAVNNFSPFVVSEFVPFPVTQHSPQSALDDVGLGIYGQGTFTFAKKLDLVIGARGDRREQEGRSEYVLLAGDRSAERRENREGLLGRVSAVRDRVPRDTGRNGVRHRVAGIQGGRLQPGFSGGSRSLRPGTQLELRGGREDDGARRSAVGDRRHVLHRLDRRAGEHPEPWRPRPVLHRQHRRCKQQGD